MNNIKEYLLLGLVALIVANHHGLLDSDYRKGVKAFDSSNYYSAQEYLAPLAMKGDRRAQWYIGLMFLEAYGTDKNEEIALKLFKKSADQNYRRAQYSLGFLYSKSKTIPRDINKAILYYKQADKQGDSDSTHMLSELYFDNNMISEEIIEWYKQKAKSNYEIAQFRLGDLYFTGIHIPQDFGEAAYWYRKSVIGESKFNWGHLVSEDIKEKCTHIKELEESADAKILYEKISKWYHENGRHLLRRCLD